MQHMRTTAVWLALAAVLAAGAVLAADTLYLRDGATLRGQLVAVRNGTVEFRERQGNSSRTIRVDVAEVRRIDFDDDAGGAYDEAPGGYDRPTGMRERTAIVSADVPFVDTGINVRAGQTVYFVAQGQVRWGPNRKDGPEGERGSPNNPNRPIPNRPAAALIGRIGGELNGSFFLGNERGPIRMREAGRLFLGINDDVLEDNSGNFRVTIYY
jgi:hypothetical protein